MSCHGLLWRLVVPGLDASLAFRCTMLVLRLPSACCREDNNCVQNNMNQWGFVNGYILSVVTVQTIGESTAETCFLMRHCITCLILH